MLWTIDGRKLKNFFLIAVAAFMAALILFIQKQDTDVFVPIKEKGAVAKIETSHKQIALTFDSNWGDRQIRLILKTLKAERVQATFFFSGEWAERHPDLIRRVLKDGHEVESHGMRHESYTQLDQSQIRRDLLFSTEAIYKAGGKRPQMFRPPYGHINDETLKVADGLRLQPVLWSVNPMDETNPGYTTIVRRVLKNTGKGDIIHLHASDSAKQTYRALPLIIRELENRGYQFETLESLLSNGQSKHQLLD
ncbi:MAG: polysaccharide deacetylase family protein [Sporolactobacillus sp.]|jgi:polysaccharide deacetylase family sporulation protein PdaB|nr:polysaccharide deacetylase family protein [Sporolactobacillus sp.]